MSFDRDLKKAVKMYRNNEKQSRIITYENTIPYVSVIHLYKGKNSDFDNLMEFCANIQGIGEQYPPWEWILLSPEEWKDLQSSGDAGFGQRSTYKHLKDELHKNKLSNASKIKEAWKLWDSWTSGDGFHNDDEYKIACVGESKKWYFYFLFKGWVIH